jgi:hypothetical protein
MKTPRSLPGPATYTLPPVIGYEYHDITRKRNPAYSFGLNKTELVKLRPDPCYIKPGQACFRKTNVPLETTKEKCVKRVRAHTPGPASYYPERCPIMRGERTPAFTIGVRMKEPMPKPAPAPNTYNIPSCFGHRISAKICASVCTIRGRPREHGQFRPPVAH